MFENNVIFGYAFTPNEGCFGIDDGGFSVELYEDGTFVYKTYIFDLQEKTRNEYMIAAENVEKIKKFLIEILVDLENFPNHIGNGSCDGYCSTFSILGKEITDYIIEDTDIDEIKTENPKYYEEYKEVIDWESFLLYVLAMVSAYLFNENIELSIEDVKIRRKHNV